jgi:hypothetical protein
MNQGRAGGVEWELVDPSRIVDVHDLVTDAHRALKSKAASSWDAEHRKAIADTLDRVGAQMRELARLAGYEGGDDAMHAELLDRRARAPH